MKNAISVLVLAAAGAFAGGAYATPITQTVDLSVVFTGAIPDGSAPWLEATFSGETDSTMGTLTLTSMLSGSDFLQGLENDHATVGWALNLDPAVTAATCDATSSSNCADAVKIGSPVNTGPVPGSFNLAFGWDSGDRFMAGDIAVYGLTFASGLSGPPIAPNDSLWESVAHVQGISPSGCSGWIVAGDGEVADGGTPCAGVPEPSSGSLFLLGMLGIGLLGGGFGVRRLG
jgi:hypothetical protein